MSKEGFFHLVRAVVSASDIVDVVSEHVALKRRGKNFIGLCPFHKEKTPSFNVSPERQIFKCFGCGAGGDAIKFVQNILNVGFKEALELLARRASIPFEYEDKTAGVRQGPSKTEIYKTNTWAAETYRCFLWDSPSGEPARKYLLGRGLTKESAAKFSLGFAASDGRTLLATAGKAGISPELLTAAGLATQRQGGLCDLFRQRVIFPILDPSGNVIAFGGRALGDEQPKYLNSPETSVFHKSRNLFALYQSRQAIQATGQVLVVEGYTDVIGAHQGGIENVVATLGTALTAEHVLLLKRYADQIVLVFDGDQAGEKAADRALSVFLTLGVDVKIAQLPAGKDPFDLVVNDGPEAFRQAISEAVEALDYKWNQVRRRHDASGSVRQRRGAIDELLTVIAGCDPWGKVDAIQQQMVLTRLAGMLSMPVSDLGRELQRFRRQAAGRRTSNESGERSRSVVLPPPRNCGEAAYRELLEVLICEPGYVGQLPETVKPSDFEPEPFAKIAHCLWRAYEELGEVALRDVLSMVEEVELADMITELHRQGINRGNFAETVEGAVRCLEDYRREQQASDIAATLGGPLSEDEMDRQLQVLQKSLSGISRRTPSTWLD